MLDNSRLDNVPGAPKQARAAVRVNLFMAATLHASGIDTAVKIRDLSADGAQIESPLIPEAGSPMTLARGQLAVAGHVTWRTERRCGLKFSSKVSVRDWMANPVNREQERVDHAVAAAKAGVVPLVSATPHATAPEGIAEDLARLSRLLESLGEAFASDPAVVAKHGIAMQNFEIVVQTLTALADTARPGAIVDVAKIDRLKELRTSCREALRNGS